MHREIVLSETYQLASDHDARDAALDPEDRWLWRYPRRRLDAESIRDAMLAVSGRLDRSRPGRHPFPPIEDWHWTQHDAFKTVYPSDHRSVYLMTQRLLKHPVPGALRRPRHEHLDRRPQPVDRPAPGALLPEQSVRAGERRGTRPPHDRRLDRPADADRRWATSWPGAGPRTGRARPGTPLRPRGCRRPGRPGCPGRPDREAWTSLARILLTANEFLYID